MAIIMEGVMPSHAWAKMLKYFAAEIKQPHEIVFTENDGMISYEVKSV